MAQDDIDREILKLNTAGIWIPEIDMDIGEGGLYSLYSTVEGLIYRMKDNITEANNFDQGDAITKHLNGVDNKVNKSRTIGGGEEKFQLTQIYTDMVQKVSQKAQIHG